MPRSPRFTRAASGPSWARDETSPADLGPDHLVDQVHRSAVRLQVGRPQAVHDRIQVAGQVLAALDGPHGGGDRAAPGMPQDHDQRRRVLQRPVLDRGGDQAVDRLRAGADSEQVADSLVEDGLRRQPRVDAGHDRRERVLPGRDLQPAMGVLVRVLKMPGRPVPVAGLEPGPCLRRGQPGFTHELVISHSAKCRIRCRLATVSAEGAVGSPPYQPSSLSRSSPMPKWWATSWMTVLRTWSHTSCAVRQDAQIAAR